VTDTQAQSAAVSTQRPLGADALLMLGTRVFVGLSSFVASVLVARSLGPSSQGTVAVALTLTFLLAQVGSLGIATANPAFVAREPIKTPAIVANSLWWAAALGALLAAAGIGLKLLGLGLVDGLSWTQMTIVVVTVPAALGALLLQSVLLGEGRTSAYNAVEFLLSAASIAALAGALLALHVGVTTAVIILLAQYPLGVVVYLSLLAGHKPPLTRPDMRLAQRMLKWALRLYLATVLSFLVVRFDMLLVNAYLGAEEAGFYSVAVVVAQGLYLVPMAVGMNLFPRVARGSGSDRTAAVFRSMAILYGLLCLGAAGIGPAVIRLLFGEQFDEAIPLFYWLLPGIFSLGMLAILSYHFAGRDYPVKGVVYWIAGLALNLGLNVAFLGEHGTYIAPLSSSVAYTFLLVMFVRLFSEQCGGYAALRPGRADAMRWIHALGKRLRRPRQGAP
jgi:O-antigen/teichoic acid export membrane protein